jgi:hypothetical protein
MNKYRLEFLPSIRKIGVRNAAAVDRADEREEKGSTRPHFLDDKAPRNVLANELFTGTDSKGCRYREVSSFAHPTLYQTVVNMFEAKMHLPPVFRIFEARRPAARKRVAFPCSGERIRVSAAPIKRYRAKQKSRYGDTELIVMNTILPLDLQCRTGCWVLAVPASITNQ